jgi:hypothetical protein
MPQTKFWPNWHIEHIAGKLEACRQGKIKRLVINVPPRSLKSLAGSIALPACGSVMIQPRRSSR